MKNILKSYISQNEILRYLHHQGQLIPNEMQNLIDDVLTETLDIIKPKYILNYLPVRIETPTIKVLSQNKIKHTKSHDDLNEGQDDLIESQDDLIESQVVLYSLISIDLCEAMGESAYFVFGAVTLGYEIVRKINALMLSSPTKAIIMDACASVIVDAYCDYIQDNLNAQFVISMLGDGYFASQRFSPGYGDLKLETQRIIADIIQAEKKLGVHLTKHFQLQPEKSVFFIIGLSKIPFKSKVKTCGNNCSECLLKNCPYKEVKDDQK